MKILVVGTGNVAGHLIKRCLDLDISSLTVQSRSNETAQSFANKFNIEVLDSESNPENFDLIILCVSDDALPKLLPHYAHFAPTVTVSGGFSIQNLKSNFPIGVFYPLQTFSRDAEIDWNQIPFFIESSNPELEEKLMELGLKLGKEAHQLRETDRIKLHVTAVFVNNFVNHINVLAKDFSDKNNIDFNWFSALISETHRKITDGSFVQQQTGPAKRGDVSTIEQHMNLLPEKLKKVYQTLSDDILNRYNTPKK